MGEVFNTVDPATNQVLAQYVALDANGLSAKLKLAQLSFDNWGYTPYSERAPFLRKCASILRKKKLEFALLITKEMGKVLQESEAEVLKCAKVCDYYADHASTFLKDERLKNPYKDAWLTYEPLGAILAVMPWNFPFWQVFRFAAPALMAGNVGLLKHAPNVFGCAKAIEGVFHEAGLPEGTFQALLVGTDSVPEIIANPIVKAVTLTGSERAGSIVAGLAGQNIKKTVLELGGSDPFIVLKDADLELALDMAVKSRMLNCGQSCIAAKRFIIEKEIYPLFLGGLKDRMASIKVGDPMSTDTQCGPMARQDLLEVLEKQINGSVEKGAHVVLGGKRIASEGSFFQPTILTDISPGMPAYHEELFGPVASIFRFEKYEQAIALANDTPFGLGASIWTRDEGKARNVASSIQAGAVFINAMVASDPALPFGGIGQSGYGRELSHLGIKEFVNVKSIVVGPSNH